MKEKRLQILMSITQFGPFIVGFTAIVSGFLLLWDNPHQLLHYQSLTLEMFPAHTLSHQLIMVSLFLLVACQLLRLVIVIFDFATARDWLYVGMGLFILAVVGWSINC